MKTTPGMVTILELPQGYHERDAVTGQQLVSFVLMLMADCERRKAEHPTWYVREYHRVVEVKEADRPPIGYEWYRVVEPGGTLAFWKANYDTSG